MPPAPERDRSRPDHPARPRHRRVVWAGLGGALVALAVTSPAIGSISIPFSSVVELVLKPLTGGLFPGTACPAGLRPGLCGAWSLIIWDVRIPEILLAVAVGAALGLSGATLQGVFRNPLADPFLLGLSSGGTLGAAVVFDFQVGFAEANLALPLLAFLGAMAVGVVVLVAARGLGSETATLLLVGVAIANLLTAFLSLVLLYNPEGSIQVSFWLLGGLQAASWTHDGIVVGGVLAAGAIIALEGRELNVLQLGPAVAQSLGVDTHRVQERLVLLASFATAMAVAFAGIIGFVGLISPHVVRRLSGPDYRVVLPGAALVGALFLLTARDLSNLVLPGTLLPVGIFTAFAGAPFFLYLLARRRRSSAGGST